MNNRNFSKIAFTVLLASIAFMVIQSPQVFAATQNITVHVTTGGGTPYGDADVNIYDSASQAYVAGATTDGNGNIVFRDLTPGTYDIIAIGDASISKRDISCTCTVNIKFGQVTVTTTTGGGSLLDSDIDFYNVSTNTLVVRQRAQSGSRSFHLPPGTYKVRSTSVATRVGLDWVVITVAAEQIVPLEFKFGRIHVLTLDEFDNPVGGASTQIYNLANYLVVSEIANANGITTSDIPPNTYYAISEGIYYTGNFTLAPEEEKTVTATITTTTTTTTTTTSTTTTTLWSTSANIISEIPYIGPQLGIFDYKIVLEEALNGFNLSIWNFGESNASNSTLYIEIDSPPSNYTAPGDFLLEPNSNTELFIDLNVSNGLHNMSVFLTYNDSSMNNSFNRTINATLSVGETPSYIDISSDETMYNYSAQSIVDGLDYLITNQNPDGGWGDNGSSEIVTTTEVLMTLIKSGANQTVINASLSYLDDELNESLNSSFNDTYMLSRMVLSFISSNQTTTNVEEAKTQIFNSMKDDNGWGYTSEFRSDPLTTLLVGRVTGNDTWLLDTLKNDSWMVFQADNVFATAEIVRSIPVDNITADIVSYLESRQNLSIVEESDVLSALLRKGQTDYTDQLSSDLEANQTPNGSFGGFIETAIAVRGLIDYYSTFDFTPPSITISSPQNTTYNVDSVDLNYSVDETTDWVGYSLDSSANITLTGNTTLTGLSDGQHNVKVYANDTEGNMNSSTVWFNIDTGEVNDFKTQLVKITIPAGTDSATASAPTDFETVDPNRTIALISGITQHAMGWTAQATQDPVEISARVEITDGSTITATRSSSSIAQTDTIWVLLIEYTGPDGGPNEFVVRDRRVYPWTSGTSSTSYGPISSVVDTSKVVVFNSGTENPNTASSNYDRGDVRAYMDGSKNVQLIRGDGSGAIESSHQVVEFTGSNWEIQTGDAVPAPDPGGTDVAISDVGDISDVWVYFSWSTSVANLDERGHRVWLTSTTNLRVQEHAAATGSKIIRWYVIRNPEMNVQTGLADNQFQNDLTATITGFNAVSDLNSSFVWVHGMTNGGGNAHPRDMWQFELMDSSTIYLQRGYSGQNLDYRYFVVELPKNVTLVNQPPVAVNDSYTISKDSTLNVPTPGVLDNDTDAENDPLSTIQVTNVSNGFLTLNANGSLTYAPNAGYTGPDSFTYKANDGLADSNVATVSITVIDTTTPSIGETKIIPNVDDTWQTVTFSLSYTNPVIVCTYNLPSSSANEAVVRINNTQNTSFDVMIQNPGDDHTVTSGDVHCTIIEEGAWTLSDERKIEAYTVNSDGTNRKNSWGTGSMENVGYTQSYTNPVVLGQVMSYSDPEWSVFWDNGGAQGNPPSSSALYIGKHVGEDTVTTRNNEVLGYIVIEQGSGTVNGIAYEAALGEDSVRGVGSSPPYSYNLGATYSVGIATQAAMDGGDGGWAVLYGSDPLASSQIALAIDEDTIGDTERSHTTEQVAYWMFSQEGIITSN